MKSLRMTGFCTLTIARSLSRFVKMRVHAIDDGGMAGTDRIHLGHLPVNKLHAIILGKDA